MARDSTSARVTLKTIHDELQRLGHDVRLEKGDGYFYFWSGEANDWLDKTVKVPTLSTLTLKQWIEEFERLKKLNHQILHAKPRVTHESRSERIKDQELIEHQCAEPPYA
jgi:hypothetical protein